ncbi:hypothetical protein LTS15_000606 [Exophiala xenobiotica]|nr:hypothetical protein LTS15_000606 [Exophiala xenobiotica]
MREHESAGNSSLGIDCRTSNPSTIALQARALPQLARLEHNNRLLADSQFPAANVKSSSEEAFNLMTIRGAKCLGLGRRVDAKNSVSMLSVAEYDPATPIFRFSEAAHVDTVIVNGVVRKRNGRLVEVAVSGGGVEGNAVGGKKTSMPWSQIAEEVGKRQKYIQARVDGLSIEQSRNTFLGMFHVDRSKLADAS